jgi:2-polyprenyl-3-methyl-5-hydroxy-6-metoxy-1,4-benzoquinol methylase
MATQTDTTHKPPTTADVKAFWEANPLCAATIQHEPGTLEFFKEHERLRLESEPAELQRELYEWDRHAGKRLLDVGCGTGYVASLYARGGATVTAVDIAERSVELTRQRLKLLHLTADVRVANAEALPFADGSFDVVSSFGVLHHTPDTGRALREVHRVLVPGGKAILMFYHRNSFAYRLLFPAKRLLQREWMHKSAQDQVNAVDGSDNPLGKVFTRQELMALMPGFTDFEFHTWELFFRHADKLPAFLSRFIAARWGWFLYVKARRV